MAKHIDIPLTKVDHDDVRSFKDQYGHDLQSVAEERKRLGDFSSVEIPIDLKKGYKYMGPIYLGTGNT